jgi:hypothetical protein
MGELLDRVTTGRNEVLAHADRPRDLGHVQVAVRVEGESVWRAEVAGAARIGGAPGLVDGTLIAETGEDVPALIDERYPARTMVFDQSVPE